MSHEDLPEAHSLDDFKTHAEISKLRLEQDVLRKTLQPDSKTVENIKLVASFGGAITAFIAIAGLLISVYQWRADSKEARSARVDERLQTALHDLGDDSSAGRRLGATVTLRSFLGDEQPVRQRQALLALTHRLGLEENATIRNVVIDVLRDVEASKLGIALLNETLNSLVILSRDAVQRGQLRYDYQRASVAASQDDANSSTTSESSPKACADSIATAMVLLLRKGATTKDLSGTYFVSKDLSTLRLDAASFNNAVLTGTDLSDASLVGGTFDGADLGNVSFVGANLKGAKFTYTRNPTHTEYKKGHYVNRELDEERQFSDHRHELWIQFPDFTNANLEDASFQGHPLFFVVTKLASEKISESVFINPKATVKFRGANLKNADFRKCAPLLILYSEELEALVQTSVKHGRMQAMRLLFDDKETGGGFRLIEFDSPGDSSLFPEFVSTPMASVQSDLKVAFSGANWRVARMSAEFEKWLSSKADTEEPPKGITNR